MKKRHLTKYEILKKHNELAELKHKQNSAPYSGMAIMCNYILWRDYGFRAERIQRFNNSVNEYLQKIDNEEITLESIYKRLFEKSEFDIEFVQYEEKDIRISKKNKYLYNLAKKEIEVNNEITGYSVKYLTIVFNHMMDLGFGKKRLEKLKTEIMDYFGKVDSGEIKVHRINKILIENGILIEMPSSRCDNYE